MHLQILLTAVGDGKTQLNGNRLLRQRFSKITAKHIQNGYTGEPKPNCPVPEWNPALKTKKAIYWELPFVYIQKKPFQNTVRFWTPKRVSMNRHKRLRDGSWTRVLDAKSGPEKKAKST